MKFNSLQQDRFREFINENSTFILETDSCESDIYGDLIGIAICATRFNEFAVLIVDTRDSAENDYLPEYVHICSIDKLFDDAIDVHDSYGYECKPYVSISDGRTLKDLNKELLDFANQSVFYSGDLEQSGLIDVINGNVCNNKTTIIGKE
tara:strand:- start:160 stop:609 length:450 start_codon:yes stop_codon:yes gene_type:complete